MEIQPTWETKHHIKLNPLHKLLQVKVWELHTNFLNLESSIEH